MYSLHIMISESMCFFHLAPGRHLVAINPREPLMRLTRRSLRAICQDEGNRHFERWKTGTTYQQQNQPVKISDAEMVEVGRGKTSRGMKSDDFFYGGCDRHGFAEKICLVRCLLGWMGTKNEKISMKNNRKYHETLTLLKSYLPKRTVSSLPTTIFPGLC